MHADEPVVADHGPPGRPLSTVLHHPLAVGVVVSVVEAHEGQAVLVAIDATVEVGAEHRRVGRQRELGLQLVASAVEAVGLATCLVRHHESPQRQHALLLVRHLRQRELGRVRPAQAHVEDMDDVRVERRRPRLPRSGRHDGAMAASVETLRRGRGLVRVGVAGREEVAFALVD